MTTSDAISPILPDFTHSPYFSFGQGAVTWHHPRKTKPEPGLERLKLHFSLLFERRNMVKIPSIATGSLGLFFQSLLACVLYVITFRTTAWCRLSAELAQRHVEAMLPELREAVLKMSHNEEFSVEFVQNNLYFLGGPQSRGRENEFDDSDEWDLDTPSLDERWNLFYNGRLHGWTHGSDFIWAIHGLLVAIFFTVNYSPIVATASLLVCCFNCICTSVAYTRKFWHLDRTWTGIEWVQALTPRPSVGVWWEVELMGMPSVWMKWFVIVYTSSFLFTEEPLQPLSENYKMCIFIGLLLGIGVLHTSYIILTTKRDNEAIERSWRARINGWVFEQQYVTPAISEGDWDRGFEMEVM